MKTIGELKQYIQNLPDDMPFMADTLDGLFWLEPKLERLSKDEIADQIGFWQKNGFRTVDKVLYFEVQ